MSNIFPTKDQVKKLYEYANRCNDRVKSAVIRFMMNYNHIDDIMDKLNSDYRELPFLHRNYIIVSIDRNGNIEAFDSFSGELDAKFPR